MENNLKEELNNDVINDIEEEENNEVQNEKKEVNNKNPEKQEHKDEKEKEKNAIQKEEKKELKEEKKKDEEEKKDKKENHNFKTPLNNKEIKNDIPLHNQKTKCISFTCIFSRIYLLLIVAILAIRYPDKFSDSVHSINKIIMGEKNKIIIGLDFGSTQSGYQIFYDSKIDFENGKIITTELIFDSYFKKGLSIGIKAKNYPKKNIEKENKLYFTKFKRNLDPKNKNNMANSTIPIGGQLENDIVIKEFLILMKEHIIENVGGINYLNIKDIKWILTVPPLLDENAKNKMRELAIKAEMRNVEIALEPEVASLAIFYEKNIGEELLKPKNTFLLVDMGGLTVDFTAMKILDENHNLEQLLEPVSYTFGSNFINDEIINIIETVYGKEKLDKVKKENYDKWEKTLEEIEKKKKEIDDNKAESFNLIIQFNDNRCGTFRDNCKFTYNGTEIPYTSTSINIPNHLILTIINDLGNKIVKKIKQKISETKEDINYIILTGGFSNNIILRKKIKNSLENSASDLIFLNEPEKTVMKGAALYGIKPNQIKKRIMPISIGISLDNNKFHTFVKRGESVDVTRTFSTDIQLSDNSILFYISYKKKEINDENKRFLDEIKLPYIDSTDKRNITILTKFSSYLSVEVKEKGMDRVIKKILYYPTNFDEEN